MSRKYRADKFMIIFFLLFITMPSIADAYIDPNTGGIFFTSVLPFVYGLLAAVVVFWKRIVLFIKGVFSKKTSDIDNKDNNDN